MDEITVKVMSSGHEVDQISRPLRAIEGRPAVTYRKRLWLVQEGCIHLDSESAPSDFTHDEVEGWEELVFRLLPEQLPTYKAKCSELLRSRFNGALAEAVTEAVACLVASGLEPLGRSLIIEFLESKSDSERLRKRVSMQLLFKQREKFHCQLDSVSGHVVLAQVATANSADDALSPKGTIEILGGDSWGGAFQPEQVGAVPDVDDRYLRDAADRTQESIGAYQALERAPSISMSGNDDSLDGMSFWEVSPATRSADRENEIAKEVSQSDAVLVRRTAALGEEAIEVLRYFCINPGDKPVHAHQVLGYPTTTISRFLTGSLGSYMRRDEIGGWHCHPWVDSVLDLMEG